MYHRQAGSTARCLRGGEAMFPQLARFTDLGLLLLRLLVALIFANSGWNHLKDPEARGKSIGQSRGFTIFLGAAEILGSLGVAFGVLTQLAAGGLILLMLGAIQKKIFVWKTGFWGKNSHGWHYDLIMVVMNLVIIFTDGGRYVLLS
jgi:putative oxidoreductase